MSVLTEKELGPREFDFTNRDFEKVRRLIYRHAGITLNESKQEMVYGRLARRLRVHGLRRFRDYLELVETVGNQEWEVFINALTTNLTAFYREPYHFPILAEHVRSQPRGRRIELWSCGCSTGEEAYSMAFTMADLYGTLTPPVRIIASDLDTSVLQKAQAGIYPLERVKRLSPLTLQRYFLKGRGSRAGTVRVRPELKELISFSRINLLDPVWPVRGPLDAIFCRNVMIYFDRQTQHRILEKFVPLLRPDGLLFAGHSESFFQISDLFLPTGKTVYKLAKRGRHDGSL